MGRMRTLKPELFRSKKLAECSIAAIVTFEGLWTEADDFGRGDADPRIIKGAIWSLRDEVTWQDVAGHLDELEAQRLIHRYEIDGNVYYEVPSWENHQAASYRRGKQVFPEPCTTESAEKCKDVQGRAEDCKKVLEQGTGNEEVELVAGNGALARDELFDAVMLCYQKNPDELTPSERGRVNKNLADLRRVNARPSDIPIRRVNYRAKFPNAADTFAALVSHWAECAHGPPLKTGKAFTAIEQVARAKGVM